MKWLWLVAAAGVLWTGVAQAFENGEHDAIDPKDRAWFKNLRSPHGALCCDMADGHRTQWRAGEDGRYEALILGEWVPVPPDAIVDTRAVGNPTGQDWVWYWIQWGEGVAHPQIRCFAIGYGG